MITTTNLDYLLPTLRLRIGDVIEGSYKYTDEWLMTALVASVNALQPFWSRKYLIDDVSTTEKDAIRNPSEWTYLYTDPPVIQNFDSMPIILMAAIIVLEGSLENLAWSLGTWRDAEISYSNIASGRTKDSVLVKLWNELNMYIAPPSKKLKTSLKGSLPGYKNNPHESREDY